MLSPTILSLVLLGVAGAMIDAHLRDWRRTLAKLADGPKTPASENAERFARGRRLRRLTASGAIAVVGAIIGLWPIIPQTPWWVATFAALLAMLAGLIFVLGVADAIANSRYYRAEQQRLIEAERTAMNEVVAMKRREQQSVEQA